MSTRLCRTSCESELLHAHAFASAVRVTTIHSVSGDVTQNPCPTPHFAPPHVSVARSADHTLSFLARLMARAAQTRLVGLKLAYRLLGCRWSELPRLRSQHGVAALFSAITHVI